MADRKQKFDMDGYVDVASRIAEVRGDAQRVYPEGSFQPFDLEHPYRVEVIGEQTYVVYVAAFFRMPDDPRPGVGAAWEPVPGRTPYTRDSELQNAETSAWGRALIAALAADTKRGIASADEVRSRGEQEPPQDGPISAANAQALVARCGEAGVDIAEVVSKGTGGRTENPDEVLRSEVGAIKTALDELAAAPL